MPELPEVETVRRGLQRLIVHKKIVRVTHDWPKSFPNAESDVREFLIGAKILEVRRRAKVLLIDLDTNYTLVIHLKMTGQLVFIMETADSAAPRDRTPGSREPEIRFGAGHPSDSLTGQLPDRSTRVTFAFDDGSCLYFNDQRKFGWMKLYPTTTVPDIDFMQTVGPEPLEDDFTPEQFAAAFKRRAKTSIKAALLDQTVVAGVGNIYADESLWGAKIHPKRLVGTITPVEFQMLYSELRLVMNLAIEKGGSTDKNYMNAEGKRGSYLDFARVFRREGRPCPRCGREIIKFRAAGRGTHICPHCQQL